RALNACRIVVAFTYLWSGVQKFNFTFATDTFPWLMSGPRYEGQSLLSEAALKLAARWALVVPVTESVLGLALLLPACRGLGVVLALGMHATILVCLGPAGHNWNTVVWPWNLALPACTMVLFWRTPEVSTLSILWPGRSVYHGAVLVLFAVMPALSFTE